VSISSRRSPHPEGRLKNRDIDADKPGRAFDSHGQGRHALERERMPTEQLAGMLDEGRVRERYDQLVLVAEPRFLGWLRDALSPETTQRVVASLDKDLGEVDLHELPKRLAKDLEGVVRLSATKDF
jgi:protein required for attachment to host cells